MRAWLVLGALLAACGGGDGDGGGGDDGGVASDASPPDARPDIPDGARDAAPPADGAPSDAAADALAPDVPDASTCDEPPPELPAPPPVVAGTVCAPCGEGCPAGGVCLTNQNTGESFCGADCSGEGVCPRGTACLDIGEGVKQCAPSTGSCRGFPPSDLGAPCSEDAHCTTDTTTCVRAGDTGYCSRACEGRCPTGFGCVEGLCRADWERGPEGCGRRSDGALGGPCGACDACAGGLTCVTALTTAELPATVRPFCTATCVGDADCPDGGRCGDVGGVRLCLAAQCECLAARGDVIEQALALAGLDRCTAIFTRGAWDLLSPAVVGDPFRLSFFGPAHDEPTRGLEWARALDGEVASARSIDGIAVMVATSARLLDAPVGDPAAPQDTSLVEAVRAIYVATGRGNRFPEAQVAAALAGVPDSLQRKAARVLHAEVAVFVARRRMLGDVTPALQGAFVERLPGAIAVDRQGTDLDMTDPDAQRLLAGGLDLGALFAAARDLAQAVAVADFAAEAGASGFDVDLATPLGRVVLRDASGGTLPDGQPILLLVDTGGDDRYEAPVGATSGLGYPVSVAIDVEGNDAYGYAGSDGEPEVPGVPPADAAGRRPAPPPGGQGYGPISNSRVGRQGSGVLGVGLLYDLAGDDTYTSLKLSQGAGVLGVGALFDGAGHDTYRCEQGCQAAAAYGIGLLLDADGRDTYTGVQMVQGFAYVRAFAALHDVAGDDAYRALLGDTELGGVHLYPNAQNPGRSNTSLAQGAGFGRRADFTDGVFASGGVGMLRDGAGDDRYTVDIFGQGTGFWFGTGLLSDAGGADTYDGRWYQQGSGAHFAMSFFFDASGDDRYGQEVPVLATAVGQGHDYSLGWFVDGAGDDVYRAPGLGLGAGHDNGIGFFLEGGGNDTYDAPDSVTFGGGRITERGAPFDTVLSLGVFVDADGTDAYLQVPAESPVGDGRTWSWEQRHPDRKAGEHGAGLDLSGATLP